jgi:hypothetical protein
MNNRRLTVLNRARMAILRAIRHAKNEPALVHLYHALRWVDAAKEFTMQNLPAASAMENAATHLRKTSVCLGFATYLETA